MDVCMEWVKYINLLVCANVNLIVSQKKNPITILRKPFLCYINPLFFFNPVYVLQFNSPL